MKPCLVKASYSSPIELALNADDMNRIKHWGFKRWWKWACDKQEKRLNGRLRKRT